MKITKNGDRYNIYVEATDDFGNTYLLKSEDVSLTELKTQIKDWEDLQKNAKVAVDNLKDKIKMLEAIK